MWTLNFGSQHVEVPWQVGLAVVIVLVFSGIIVSNIIANSVLRKEAESYFACPWCSHRFKPGLKKLKHTIHITGSYYLKCPKCGKVDFCSQSYEQDNE